jgi:hypothetical protein
MIQGDDADEYAQIGYLRYTNGSAITFTEFSSGNGGNDPDWRQRTYGGIFSNGTTHSYSVAYNFSTDRISMVVDQSQKDQTPWGAPQEWGGGMRGTFAGETHDPGDDIPGTSDHKVRFQNLRAKTCHGCALADPDVATVNLAPTSASYKFEWVTNPTYFRIWTER